MVFKGTAKYEILHWMRAPHLFKTLWSDPNYEEYTRVHWISIQREGLFFNNGEKQFWPHKTRGRISISLWISVKKNTSFASYFCGQDAFTILIHMFSHLIHNLYIHIYSCICMCLHV